MSGRKQVPSLMLGHRGHDHQPVMDWHCVKLDTAPHCSHACRHAIHPVNSASMCWATSESSIEKKAGSTTRKEMNDLILNTDLFTFCPSTPKLHHVHVPFLPIRCAYEPMLRPTLAKTVCWIFTFNTAASGCFTQHFLDVILHQWFTGLDNPICPHCREDKVFTCHGTSKVDILHPPNPCQKPEECITQSQIGLQDYLVVISCSMRLGYNSIRLVKSQCLPHRSIPQKLLSSFFCQPFQCCRWISQYSSNSSMVSASCSPLMYLTRMESNHALLIWISPHLSFMSSQHLDNQGHHQKKAT